MAEINAIQERIDQLRKQRGIKPEPKDNMPNTSNSKPAPKLALSVPEFTDAQLRQRRDVTGQGLFARANLPDRHRKFVREGNTYEPWDGALSRIRSRLGSSFLFVLVGDRGRGKTQIAAELVRHACFEKLMDSHYVTAAHMFMRIRSSYQPGPPSEEQVVEMFVKPKLLVIDAMEVQADTEAEYRMLNTIIDDRYGKMNDTLLITNETRKAFGDRIGPSIVTRIKECGDVIECNWNSFRTKG